MANPSPLMQLSWLTDRVSKWSNFSPMAGARHTENRHRRRQGLGRISQNRIRRDRRVPDWGAGREKIGDPIVMVSGDGEREAMPAFLYVYVEDADETYRRAIGAGGESIEEPKDTPLWRPTTDER
ncbi:VOC family protein [Mesorhizobium calcicola]|uniref:VOC family protein n=1 Tax=Mesorhizobium calcicola TaxID=1300310 RepID=A0ABW4WN15_9HYPH